jgi:hypothetical protein
LVERVLGKDEVTSSILVNGSRFSFEGQMRTWRKKNLTAANRT